MDKFMRELASMINANITDRYGEKGFTLLVFEFNKPGLSNYISNADRQSMIVALRETADRLEKNQDIPPVHPTMQ